MRRCTIFVSLFFSIIANNTFTQEVPALGYVPDMESPAILQRVERFLDEYIDPKHSAEYRQVIVRPTFQRCDITANLCNSVRFTLSNSQLDFSRTASTMGFPE